MSVTSSVASSLEPENIEPTIEGKNASTKTQNQSSAGTSPPAGFTIDPGRDSKSPTSTFNNSSTAPVVTQPLDGNSNEERDERRIENHHEKSLENVSHELPHGDHQQSTSFRKRPIDSSRISPSNLNNSINHESTNRSALVNSSVENETFISRVEEMPVWLVGLIIIVSLYRHINLYICNSLQISGFNRFPCIPLNLDRHIRLLRTPSEANALSEHSKHAETSPHSSRIQSDHIAISAKRRGLFPARGDSNEPKTPSPP
jgi:hypothetical protein